MQPTSLTWNNEIEAGVFTPGLTARDGDSIAGERGYLRIALQTSSLRLGRGERLPSCWLLPLNSAEMVRLSGNLSGELLWLSPRQPQNLAGLLISDFRGAWWASHMAMLKVQDAVEVYFVSPEAPGAGSMTLLAQIVALRWSGWPPARIHAALRLHEAGDNRPSASRINPQLAVA